MIGKIRVLFVGLKYDYGVPERGSSFEHTNFFHTLAHMENLDVTLFPFDEVIQNEGREGMNRQLLETVNVVKPDICFFFLRARSWGISTERLEKHASSFLHVFPSERRTILAAVRTIKLLHPKVLSAMRRVRRNVVGT